MDQRQAARDVLLGASLRQISVEYRQDLIDAFGFRPEEVRAETFADETAAFMRKLARELGERHAGDPRVAQALLDWIMECDHYEAWDALLSGFAVEGRERLIRRGRILFPGPLTAHWSDS